jgi:hypothetical protein
VAKDSGSPDVLPIAQGNEIKPRGLLEAMAYIEQSYANERGGCMIDPRFLTTKLRLEFMEVGAKSSFASGMIMAILAPVAIGVFEHYIPIFGDPDPTWFDIFCAALLAMGFALGYALLMAKVATRFIGPYTRGMVVNLIGGTFIGAIGKAIFAMLAYHFLRYIVLTDKNLVWAVLKLHDAKVKPGTLAELYYGAMGFKGVLLSSAYFIQTGTAIFIFIPSVALTYTYFRNRRLIAAGIVHVISDRH